MIELVATAAVFVAVAVVAFVAAVRLGMLVGLRLDRALEARAAQDGSDEPVTSANEPIADGRTGREENRGE
jgi:Xaa-Pro aminopeptidase